MSLKVAFQMDPIQNVNIDADSTFRLAEEAQARGHSLFFYTPDRLAFEDGRVTARGQAMVVQRVTRQSCHAGRPPNTPILPSRCGLAAAGPALRHGLYHHDAYP